ncbi:hypothetical protein A0J61_07016 [Choanephora cucurbitarum]|uniref:Uncharacterized protein n=1 Tax=Choanephora cucurbitarum TaxID=101091 RepID=A0A1C7N7J0_9FUNG|nr:hypothetical protein A0J61_07016 [Choanephora cucurbitarum]
MPKSLYLSDSLCTDMEIPLVDKKITFTNQTYETFRLQHSPPQCGTSVLPLLFDFFHLTSQPAYIWDSFNHYYKQRFCASPSETASMESSNHLLKEAIRLFVTHNLLYSMFIDSQTLIVLQSDPLLFASCLQSVHVNEYKSSSRHPVANRSQESNYDLLLVFGILSLTFSSLHEHEKNDDLIEHAMAFYQKAHTLFFQLSFPVAPSDPASPALEQKDLFSLLKATILLAHFQCSVISPEQAFTTIRIGLDILHRTPFELDEEGLVILKTLDAWHIWLAFYLCMPYTHIVLAKLQREPTLSDSKFTKEQQWAFDIVDSYSQLMRITMKRQKSTHSQQTKESLLSSFSLPTKPLFDFVHHGKNPWLTISLFQHVLDIHIKLFSLKHNLTSFTHTYSIDSFVKSSQHILDISSKIVNYFSHITTYFSQQEKIEHFNELYSTLNKIAKASTMCRQTLEVIVNQLNHPEFSLNADSAIKRRERKRLNKLKKTTAPPSPSPSSSSDATAVVVSRTKPSISITSCDTGGGAMISNTTSQPDTPSTMSQFLAHPTIPSELLLMESTKTPGLDHMASHPTSIHSRADIDREQLEKLSHKPSRLQQQYQQYQHEQQILIQQQRYQRQWSELDLQPEHSISSNNHPNSHYLFSSKYTMPSSIHTTHSPRHKNEYNTPILPPQDDINDHYHFYQNNNKRNNHHSSSNFNLQTYKKFKPNVHITTSHYNQKQPSQNQPFHDLQENSELVSASSEQDRSRQNSLANTPFIDVNELTSEPQSTDDDAALMYWMLDSNNNPNTFYQVATTPSTPTAIHPPLSSDDTKSETELVSSPVQQTHFGYQNSSTPQSNSIAAIQSWQPSVEVDDTSLNAVTKLPLPQPSKSVIQPVNHWATSASKGTWSKFFFASEMQTLHYQTPPLVHYNEQSPFPMHLNMIQEEHRQPHGSSKPFFYSYHQKNLTDRSNRNLVVLPSQPIQTTNAHEDAVAAAVWAATADKTNSNDPKDVTFTPKRRKHPNTI